MKLITPILVAIAILTSCTVTQRAEGTFLLNAQYNFSFEDKVTIKIGSAVKSQTNSQWQGGSTVGNHQISGEVFNELQSTAGEKYNFKIKSTGLNNIHEIIAKNIATGKTMKGTYNYASGVFTFAGASSSNSNSMEVGQLKGKFSKDFSTISNGQFKVGWIVGQVPVVVSADATFFYTGRKAQ